MISASYNRIIDWKLQHPPAHYWHKNLYATFIDDPLGLSLIDQIGVDRALWSLDYPHVESTFGWSRTIIKNIVDQAGEDGGRRRSEEHTSELKSLMRISYAVFCLKKTKTNQTNVGY